ncbi:MAG: carbohydrate kinase [Cellvibrionaceae bacterium]|nr:carbohydrate kinase [Cellvibrionaceae bacterium]
MSENCVVAFGEALIDFCSKQGAFYPFTGGAPANVAVAVSKLGGESFFIGSVGDDFFGEMILQDLQSNGTNIQHTLKLDHLPTAAAYVSIDGNGERSFSFSRHDTADMHYPVDKIPLDLFKTRQGIFHFGSNSLTTEYQAAVTMAFAALAKQCGWFVSFDVNLRANLWPGATVNKERVKRCMAIADYIKLSDEELADIKPAVNASFKSESEEIFTSLQVQADAIVIVTSGPGAIKLYAAAGVVEYLPPKVTAIDTTGAGDAFFGAFVYFIAENNCFSREPEDYLDAVKFAAKCGAYSVRQMGAISSYPTLSDLQIAS